MSVFKNEKNNTWTCKFYYKTVNGERKQKKKEGFKTKAAAREFEENFKNKMLNSPDITVANLYERYMEFCATDLRKSTNESKDSVYRTKILPFFGDIPISDVTSLMVKEWQKQMKLEDYKPTYLKNMHNQLSALFNFAVQYFGLNSNPAKQCGSMGKKDADCKQFWTKEEFNCFLSHLTDRPMATVMFSLLFYSGMRSGELLALDADSFDFEQNLVRIDKTYAKIKGEDIISEPKTENSKRIVTLPQEIMDMVTHYISSLYGYESDQRLFPITKKMLNNEMKRGCNRSGVKKIRVHDLRHSHASLIINETDFPVLVLKERLGHKDIKTTLNTYSHLYENQHRDLANKLSDLMKQ